MFAKLRFVVLSAALGASPFVVTLVLHAEHAMKAAGRTGCC